MHSKKLRDKESDILVAIQNALFDAPGVVRGARGLSHLGEHALGWMGTAAVGASVDRKRRNQWLALGVSAFISHALSVVVKRIVRRPRPNDDRIRIGVGTPSRLSFPSSHSTSTAATMDSLAQITGSPLPYLGIPVMMGSRMVLGVHFPTDTLAGAAIGVVTSRVVNACERKIR